MARRNGVTTFRDKYNWSGSGTIDITTLVPEHTIHAKGQRNIWQMYEVDLGTALKKRESHTVAVKWTLTDSAHQARPFMSQTIDVPTKELRFRLRVPQTFGITTGRKLIRQSIDTLDIVHSEDAVVINGEVEWTVKTPKLLHCYELNWVDPGGEPFDVQADLVDGEEPRF